MEEQPAFEFENPRFTMDGGGIDVRFNHPALGWCDYTARGDDPISRPLFEAIVAAGNVAPYDPPPAPTPSTDPRDYPLEPWQFKAMVKFLDLDEPIRAAISKEPDPMMRAMIEALYEDSKVYERSHPLFDLLAPKVPLDTGTLDAAWLNIGRYELFPRNPA